MDKITQVHARQIIDSRGNPTVEVDLFAGNNIYARASVPSGASTGTREAIELRDNDPKNFLGKSVQKAVSAVNEVIAPKLKGQSCLDQKAIDELLLELDGSENKQSLGANALLAVSLASAKLGATVQSQPLFRYLRHHLHCPAYQQDFVLPAPMMNIINGGEHASNNLDIQEFMIIPHIKGEGFSRNLQLGVEVFHHLKKVLSKKNYSTNVGDEGGFAPSFENHREALDCILMAAEQAGYRPGEHFSFCFDAAASEFYDEKTQKYRFEGKDISSEELIHYYEELLASYPVYSLEDGLSELDQQYWPLLTEKVGDKILTVGDDLFVTNTKYLQRGIDRKEANSILIKVNQIGTLTETFAAMNLAATNKMSSIISHRSGETAENFIADLAVATSCGLIKTGSASRSDRIEKYNQLLRIEEVLGAKAQYNCL